MSQSRPTAKAIVSYIQCLVHIDGAVRNGVPLGLFGEFLSADICARMDEKDEDDEMLILEAMLDLVISVHVRESLHKPDQDPSWWEWKLTLCRDPMVMMNLEGDSPYRAAIEVQHGPAPQSTLSLTSEEHSDLEKFIAAAPIHFGEKWT